MGEVSYSYSNVCHVPADFFDVHTPIEHGPTTTMKTTLGCRILQRQTQETRIATTCLQHEVQRAFGYYVHFPGKGEKHVKELLNVHTRSYHVLI